MSFGDARVHLRGGPRPPGALVRTPNVRHPLSHPAGHSLVQQSISTQLSTTEFINSLLNNVQIHRYDSVTLSSKATYNTGWKVWCDFVHRMGTDVNASHPPPEWEILSSGESRSPSSWLVSCVCSFLSYCRTVRGLLPSTCSNYLSGVLFMLRMRDVSIREITESNAVAETKAGLMRAWREDDERNAVAARSNLPFTASMIDYALQHFLTDWASDPVQHGLKVALILGFMLCARPSEILQLPHRNGRVHFLRGKDVRFTVRHKQTNNHVIVGSDRAYIVDQNDYVLVNALPHVRHSKADQHGEGTPYVWPTSETCAKGAFNVTTVLYRWAIFARPGQDMPFLSWNNNRVVDPAALTLLMKRTASSLSLDASRFTLRSLRYGGATQLVAIGASDSFIQLAGRWKSLAFLRYIKLASSGYMACIGLMADPTAFTVQDVRSICTTSTSTGAFP